MRSFSQTVRIKTNDRTGSNGQNVYLEVFHEYSDDDVDQHKLRDEDEDYEVDWSYDCVDTTVV